MKKFLTTILFVMLTAFLAACGGGDDSSNQDDSNQEEQSGEENQDKKENKDTTATKDIKDDQVVAKVNGEDILGKELKSSVSFFEQRYQQMGQDPSKMADQIQKQALDNLISIELVKQKAKEQGIKPSEDKIQEEYKKQIEQVKKATDLKKEKEILKENNTTEKEVKENIRQNLITTQYLEENVEEPKVTEKDLKKAYDSYKKAMEQQGQKVDKSLEDLKDQLKQQVKNQKSSQKEMEHLKQLRKKAEVEILI